MPIRDLGLGADHTRLLPGADVELTTQHEEGDATSGSYTAYESEAECREETLGLLVPQKRWYSRPLLPTTYWCGNRLKIEETLTTADAEMGLVAVKLLLMALGCIAFARWLICEHLGMECDLNYDLQVFFVQDFHKVVMDLAFLLLVGRMGPSSPVAVDSVVFVTCLVMGASVPSLVNLIPAMQVSFSQYQIMCKWQSGTFMAVSFVFLIVALLVSLHARYIFRSLSCLEKCRFFIEGQVIVAIFVLPRFREPAFHAHHWFTAWLAALFCRFPKLWSRGLQAFLVGMYLNGIAVYGRDPVLACESAFLSARSLQCQWFQSCMMVPVQTPPPGAEPLYKQPDWRTCDPGDYA